MKLFARKKVFGNPLHKHVASEFEVNNWILSDFVLQRLIPAVGHHPFPLNELMLMASAVCYFRPALILEWGTHIGKSARVFYETTKAFGIDCEIHSTDLPDDIPHQEHPHRKRGKLVNGLNEVILHHGDGLTCSLEICRRKTDSGNRLFFVDGDHEYETVRSELDAILTAVPNASVLLHDTFYQSEEANYNIGPYKAVKDVLANYGNKYKVIQMNTGLPGMTLVYPRKNV
jgi:cephalosporin hydroxylase